MRARRVNEGLIGDFKNFKTYGSKRGKREEVLKSFTKAKEYIVKHLINDRYDRIIIEKKNIGIIFMDNSIVTLDLKDSYLSISDSRIYLPNKEIVDFYKQIIEIDIRNKRTDELSQKRLN